VRGAASRVPSSHMRMMVRGWRREQKLASCEASGKMQPTASRELANLININERMIRLIESGMDWESYERHFSFWNRPPRKAFVEFVDKRLAGKLASEPIEIKFSVSRGSANHLYLNGTVRRNSGFDHVEGEAVWLPTSQTFRGHLLINRPSAEELRRQEIEVLRKQA
jgi:hypothetical protein